MHETFIYSWICVHILNISKHPRFQITSKIYISRYTQPTTPNRIDTTCGFVYREKIYLVPNVNIYFASTHRSNVNLKLSCNLTKFSYKMDTSSSSSHTPSTKKKKKGVPAPTSCKICPELNVKCAQKWIFFLFCSTPHVFFLH